MTCPACAAYDDETDARIEVAGADHRSEMDLIRRREAEGLPVTFPSGSAVYRTLIAEDAATTDALMGIS